MPAHSPINGPLKSSPQYRLPHSRTCCLLLSNSFNRRSLTHTLRHVLAQSLDLLPRIQSTSHTGRLDCAPRRYPIVEPRQLQLPRPCVLGLLQQIRGTTFSPIHSEKRDHRLKATSPERGECGNLVSAVRQTWKEHCRSRREDSIPWFWRSPPLLGFMLSPLDTMSPNHGRGATPVHAARQTCGEAFLPLVVCQPSSGRTVA